MWNATERDLLPIDATNTTTTPPTSNDLRLFTHITIIFSIITIIAGSIGNTAVLVIFARKWKHLKNCEMFMMNLAISDLIGSIIIPLQFVIELLEYDVLPFGHLGCKLVSSISTTCVSVSSFVIVAITTERFVVIILKSRRKFGRTAMASINIGMWMLGGVFGLYCLISDGVRLFKEDSVSVYVCRDKSSLEDRKIYYLVTCSFQVIIPLFIVTILCVLLIHGIHQNATNTLLKDSSREHRKRARISKRAIRLVYMIIVAFFVCQLPVNIFFFTIVFNMNNLPWTVTIRLYYVLHTLQLCSNCVNPLIYCKLHHYFRNPSWSRVYKWFANLLYTPSQNGKTIENNIHLHNIELTPNDDAVALSSAPGAENLDNV